MAGGYIEIFVHNKDTDIYIYKDTFPYTKSFGLVGATGTQYSRGEAHTDEIKKHSCESRRGGASGA